MNNTTTSTPKQNKKISFQPQMEEKSPKVAQKQENQFAESSRSQTPSASPNSPTKDLDATEDEEFNPFETKRTEPFR